VAEYIDERKDWQPGAAMKRFLGMRCLLALLLLSASAAAAEYSPEVAKRIAAVENGILPQVRIKGKTVAATIPEQMARHHVPGVSVAVINNYEIEWAKGYGKSDTQTGASVTPDTLFQAGSVSKPIAAVAALKLVQDGVLDLDRNVNDQLKSWKVPDNNYTAEHPVDLRSLLSHTAGLTVHGFGGYAPDATLPTVPEILDGKKPANTPAVRVNKVPGNGFRYSGGGTTVMQQLVIDVTGEPFPEFVKKTVLAPLGMTRSTYQQPLDEASRPIAASGHHADEKPMKLKWKVHPEMAAAGLWTTPSDVARYVIEVELAHERKSDKVLKPEMIDQMLTPQGGGPVGLGPFLRHEGQRNEFEHGGRNEGFVCQFIGLLDRGQGAVVMTNSDLGHRVIGDVIDAIAATYGWPGFEHPEREAITLDASALDQLVGKYRLGPLDSFTIRRDGQRLFAKGVLGGEMEMYFENDLAFFTDDPGFKGTFVKDELGRGREIVINSNGRERRIKRVGD
jgi:CubicO group peptidase (beta-lactamase class C family)